MPLLLLGVMVSYLAAFTWGVWDGFSWLQYQREDIPGLALILLLFPACSAWIGAEVVHAISPRRAFDRRVRARGTRLLLGLAAGFVGIGAGAALLPVVDRFVPDALTMGACCAFAVGSFMLLLKRRCPGHCIACGYDQKGMPAPGQPGAGICPECGTPVHAGRDHIPAGAQAAIS